MVTVKFIRKDSPHYNGDHVEGIFEIPEADDYIIIENLAGSFNITTDERCYVSHKNEFEEVVEPDNPLTDIELIKGLQTVVARDDVDFPDWDDLRQKDF